MRTYKVEKFSTDVPGENYSGIKEKIFSKVQAGDQLVAFIDPCSFPEIDDLIQKCHTDFIVMAPGFAPGDLLPVLPRIFRLDKDNEIILEEIIHRFGYGVGFIISSSRNCDITALAAHFNKLCHFSDSKGQAAWLRFYDPYVLNTLFQNASPYLCNSLFGKNISSFIMEDFLTNQYCCYIADEKSNFDTMPHLTMTDELIEFLDEAHYNLFLYNIHCYYFNTVKPNLTEIQKNKAKSLILTNVFAAEEFGFDSMAHIFRFAKLAFKHGWEFYEYSPFAELLQQNFTSNEQKLARLEEVKTDTRR